MATKENAIIKYLKESLEELKKVVWPTKTEVKNHTILVIVMSLALAGFLYILDSIFTSGLDKLILR